MKCKKLWALTLTAAMFLSMSTQALAASAVSPSDAAQPVVQSAEQPAEPPAVPTKVVSRSDATLSAEADIPSEAAPAPRLKTVAPAAQTAITSGTTGRCGDDLTWDFNTNTDTLTVRGTGSMWGWEYDFVTPWYQWMPRIQHAVIEEGVTEVGMSAFSGCTALTSVSLPETLERISDEAFWKCTALGSVEIPASICDIRQSSFYGCSSLTSVTCHYDADSSYNFDIDEVFGSWEAPLESARFISPYGDNLTTELDILTGVFTVRGDGKMDESVTVPWRYNNISTFIKKVVFDGRVTSIAPDAFTNCEKLTEIVIPDTVTSIGEYAFYYCVSLNEPVIPASVTSIGQRAFMNAGFEAVTVPATVTFIGDEAFTCTIRGYRDTAAKEYADNYYVSFVDLDPYHPHGECGEGLTWELDEETDTLTITGSGDMWDYDDENTAPWGTAVRFVVFDGGITSIGSRAFARCEQLAAVRLPDTVRKIGDYAFYDCARIVVIAIPEGVTSIGTYAFAACADATAVVWPDSLRTIGDYAFENCSGLTEIILPEGVESIGYGAFWGCDGVTDVVLPASVTSLDYNMFVSCRAIRHMTLHCLFPQDYVARAEALTDYSEALESFVMEGRCGDGLTYCYDVLTHELTVSGDGDMWDFTEEYSMTDGNQKKVIFDGNITSIGDYAFYDHDVMSEWHIPDTVVSIGDYAFCGSYGRGELAIPASVISIGKGAFLSTDFDTVVIPATVTSVGADAFTCTVKGYRRTAAEDFANLSGLPFIDLRTEYPEGQCGDTLTWTLDKETGELIITGDGDMWDYDDMYDWNDGENESDMERFSQYSEWIRTVVIGEGVTSIGNEAFAHCNRIEQIVIPDTVVSIGADAFCGCWMLQSLEIPASVASIGSGAFEWCRELTDIDVDPENTAYTSLNGVLYNSAMTEIIRWPSGKEALLSQMPDTVQIIADGAFGDCYVEEIVIPDGVTTIGSRAFVSGDPGYDVSRISLPASVVTIGDYAFAGCVCAHVTIPATVRTIGERAFCPGYDLPCDVIIDVPDSITDIGREAFIGSSNMLGNHVTYRYDSAAKTAYIEGFGPMYNNPVMGEIGYWDVINKNAETVEVADGVTHIGTLAFCHMRRLKEVNLPETVVTIGDGAFEGCSALSSLIIPKSVTGIYIMAFEGMEALSDIYYTGSQEEWNAIRTLYYIDDYHLDEVEEDLPSEEDDFRYYLDGVTIHYDYAAVQPLAITAQPADVTAKVGENVSFSVEATGADLRYQWYYKKAGAANWSKWNGRITATTTAPANATWNGMQVYCQITDKSGDTVDSAAATITVTQELKITGQPQSQSVKLGKAITLSVKAEGIGLRYQWYFKKAGASAWSKWNGRTKATETVTPNATWNGIQLYCVVKDDSGKTVDSDAATVTLTQDLKITGQPQSQSVKLGNVITLSVKAEGIGLRYQWYFKKAGAAAWSKWNGRTHATETVTPNATWNGIQLYCVVKDASGKTVDSDAATVTLTQDLKITVQPKSQSVKLGNAITLSVKAEGIGMRYQWYFKKAGAAAWSKWNGRTHATETVTPNATWNGIQLYCVVKDASGKTVDSNAAKITVTQDLRITQQPKSQSVKLGNAVTLSVKAEGIGLRYQWYFKKAGAAGWTKWNGRTHATETVTPNATWNGIQLYCVVKDASGKTVDSNAATVTLTQELKITEQPESQGVKLGNTITLSVKAEGVDLRYQWYYKKVGDSGWTKWNGRTHAIETVKPNVTWNGIQLYCAVTDGTGKTVKSDTVKVVVQMPLPPVKTA